MMPIKPDKVDLNCLSAFEIAKYLASILKD
jgi:hypothetical protein